MSMMHSFTSNYKGKYDQHKKNKEIMLIAKQVTRISTTQILMVMTLLTCAQFPTKKSHTSYMIKSLESTA